MRDGDLLAMAVCGGNAGATCTRTAATCRCCLQICIELLAGLREGSLACTIAWMLQFSPGRKGRLMSALPHQASFSPGREEGRCRAAEGIISFPEVKGLSM